MDKEKEVWELRDLHKLTQLAKWNHWSSSNKYVTYHEKLYQKSY